MIFIINIFFIYESMLFTYKLVLINYKLMLFIMDNVMHL